MIKRSAINEKELLERFGLSAIEYYTGYRLTKAVINKESVILYNEQDEKIDIGNFIPTDDIDKQLALL
jgi:hypothetical protein